MVLNAFRNSIRGLLPSRSVRAKLDPNTPFALYFEPSGRVRPITMKSMAGFTDGEYNALNASMNRSSNATANEIGYAYISEINVWVRRCIEIRASNIKRLKWFVEDRHTGREIEGHPLTIAMNRSRHLLQRSSRSLDIWGELYLKPLENEHGFYSDVQWLNNLSVNLTIVNGFVTNFYYSPIHGGKPASWPASEMCYIYTENSFDDLRGSSKILSVLAEANVHEEIARASQAHFANDARPGIMFIPEQDIGIMQSQEFIDFWKANFQGTWNANKPVLMPAAIKSVQTLERAKLEDDIEMRGSIRREICAAFGVPLSVAGAWDDANYQSAPEQRKSLYEDTIIPAAEQLADDMTRSLLPFFGNPEREQVWFDAKNLLALAEDKQAKATALNSQLISGGLTLNEYREAMDMDKISEGDVYYIPSSVTVTPINKLGNMPSPMAPLPFGAPTQSEVPGTVAPADPALPAGPTSEPTKDSPGVSVVLSLANNTDLRALQDTLKTRFKDQPIEWLAPDMLHITLASAPQVDEAALEQLVSYIMAYPTPAFDLTIGSLATFDKVGQHALHFRIRQNEALKAYQEDIYLACQQLGIQTVQYSVPNSWTPHVTMGYSKQRIPLVTVQKGPTVAPAEVQVSVKRGNAYEVIGRASCGQPETIPATPPAAAAAPTKSEPEALPSGDAFLDELAAYEKFVLNRWGKSSRPFEFHLIDGDLRTELVRRVTMCTQKGQVKQLFDGLRTHLAERLEKTEEADADIVTLEQAQEWWGDYDRLMTTLGNDWLRDYMREAWRRLQSRLSRDISVDDVQTLLETFHPDLIQQWTGTAEEPGVIAKLFMAGMGAGQQALERKRTNMNPLKASELNIDWDLVPTDAIAAVEKYVGKLIRGIDATTLADVQRIITQWLESGGTLAELTEQLTPIFNDPARAALIAQTESSNAYNSGAMQRWTDVGVTKMKFKTVRDSKVCPQCEALAGEIGTLEGGWDGIFIPVHPCCRCYASPVL